jgi:hypothetical protein
MLWGRTKRSDAGTRPRLTRAGRRCWRSPRTAVAIAAGAIAALLVERVPTSQALAIE